MTMKNEYKLHLIAFGIFYALILFFLTSCEQDEAVVELNTAPGGGTVSTYKAYTVSSATEDDIYGRIVFYKDNSDFTLVQVSLYNTSEEVDYLTTLFSGTSDLAEPSPVKELYTVDGATGEFSPSKFYVIPDKTFYDGLDEFDAHLKIMAGETIVSAGNVGKNALPVAESE
jgi:hypothetical protein